MHIQFTTTTIDTTITMDAFTIREVTDGWLFYLILELLSQDYLEGILESTTVVINTIITEAYSTDDTTAII